MPTSINIDYDENTLEYYGVTLGEERFATGDPVKDFADARNAATKYDIVMEGSSLTHFVFDVAGYRFDDDDNLVKD